MSEELVRIGKTKTGGLDFNVAAGLCYLPFFALNIIVSGVMLIAEPREHRFVRYHAMQSFTLFGLFFGGAMVFLIGGMMILPALLFVLAGIFGAILSSISEDLGAAIGGIIMLLAFVSYFAGAILSIVCSAMLPVSSIGTAIWVFAGGSGRWPVLGGLIERFV